MKNIQRLAFVTVLSILPVSCSIMFVNPAATLAEHKPMPKNVGLSATTLPDLSQLKLDPQEINLGMGVKVRQFRDSEGNLVSRVYSMPWEPEKNAIFEWRIAIPQKDNPASWEWKYFAAFEDGLPYEVDAAIKFGDPKTDEQENLTALTAFIVKDQQAVAAKTFVRPQPPVDKK